MNGYHVVLVRQGQAILVLARMTGDSRDVRRCFAERETVAEEFVIFDDVKEASRIQQACEAMLRAVGSDSMDEVQVWDTALTAECKTTELLLTKGHRVDSRPYEARMNDTHSRHF